MSQDKTIIAKLKKAGKEFEIVVPPEQASLYKQGKAVSLSDVLVIEEIYEDARKGKRASEKEMENLFGTSDVNEVAALILKEGHVPVTEDMMKKEIDQRKKQIVTLLHTNTVDPTTNRPHPPGRIETAMSDAKIKIEGNKSAESQLQDIVKLLRPHLPLKFETRQLYLHIPVKHAGKALSILKQSTTIIKESWENDGSLTATVEVPAGIQEQLEYQLNTL